jgi:dephospho-CoA kinase
MKVKIFESSIDRKVREYLLNDPEIREQLERLQAKIVDKYLKERYGD